MILRKIISTVLSIIFIIIGRTTATYPLLVSQRLMIRLFYRVLLTSGEEFVEYTLV